eukprot:CAMPEP_0194130158 /NCGR_PEP_ID=MMETSP0152-20130528/1268_1 /TAXON_ID=1049557 /ORGANISM="Thalassiothrix antarctica, Strain L6-D1" /LENGTH=525 /DNA_ID=CAMNT_0038824585 /DNA_START=46 /DNA_END=1623 /DNA_ORIENTATION=+
MRFFSSILSLFLVGAASTATSSSSLRRNLDEESCLAATNERSCAKTKDNEGQSCVWCECKAVPSECVTQEQAKSLPSSVFTCKSASSSRLDRMEIREQTVDDEFCDVNSKSGYISLDDSKYDQKGEDKHLFYWMFEKRGSSEDGDSIPFIVWLTGGPGCSSSLALLTENGPCSVNKDGKSTSLNPYSWTEAGHVLWLDQPAGVGFSYGSETDKNEEMISEDAYWFLQKFFQEHPEFDSNPLFIVGESYGGHYVPSIAHKVFKYNTALPEGATKLNLAGIAIGNGLTAPEEQYPYYPEMAFNNSHGIKVIPESVYKAMKAVVPKCTALIHQCNRGDGPISAFACQSAFLVCNAGLTSPYQMTGLNPYDIRKKCEKPPLCYDFSYVTKFMHSEETKKALGVDPKHSHNWESCNFGINMKFHSDWMKDFSKYVAELINGGIPALMYAGDVDFICNYLGNEAWTYNLNWLGGDDFRATNTTDWNNNAGLARSHGPLTFLQVFDGGHMVPADKPQVALDMIKEFVTQGTL